MFVYKREVRTTFRGATQTEYFVLNKAFTRHSKTGQCHFNSSWKEASPTLRLVLTVLMSVYFWSKGKEYIYIVTIADFSPTFVDVHTSTGFSGLSFALPSAYVHPLFYVFNFNGTRRYRIVEGSPLSLHVSLTLYWSSSLSLGLFCGHSLVWRLNLDVVADSSSLSLLTRLVSVIRYVSTYSVCLFFLCVYCWIPCICW